MFRHTEGMIIPQRNHAQFAGVLAALRWNAEFWPPPIAKDAFVLGVADHDRWYDPDDVVDFLSLDGEEKIVQRKLYIEKSIERENISPVANAIVLRHVLNLAKDYPDYQGQLQVLLSGDLPLDHIQSIVDFLDDIAFDLSIGNDAHGEVPVYDFHSNAFKKITYALENGQISCNPRPFLADSFEIPLYGYRSHNYPDIKILQALLYIFQK